MITSIMGCGLSSTEESSALFFARIRRWASLEENRMAGDRFSSGTQQQAGGCQAAVDAGGVRLASRTIDAHEIGADGQRDALLRSQRTRVEVRPGESEQPKRVYLGMDRTILDDRVLTEMLLLLSLVCDWMDCAKINIRQSKQFNDRLEKKSINTTQLHRQDVVGWNYKTALEEDATTR